MSYNNINIFPFNFVNYAENIKLSSRHLHNFPISAGKYVDDASHNMKPLLFPHVFLTPPTWLEDSGEEK